MEHRYYPRLEASFKVGLFKDDEFLGCFETRDISLDGICIKMSPLGFERNDVVGLLISINGKPHMQKGMVVHASQRTVGIMMIEISKEIFQGIFNLFKARRIPMDRLRNGIERRMPAEPQLSLPRLIEGDEPREKTLPTQIPREIDFLQSRGLIIRIGRRLDISSTMQFNQAIKAIRDQALKVIVIDLIDTEYLFDSGLALLMLLQMEASDHTHRFYLINGNSKIIDRLSTSPVAAAMQIL